MHIVITETRQRWLMIIPSVIVWGKFRSYPTTLRSLQKFSKLWKMQGMKFQLVTIIWTSWSLAKKRSRNWCFLFGLFEHSQKINGHRAQVVLANKNLIGGIVGGDIKLITTRPFSRSLTAIGNKLNLEQSKAVEQSKKEVEAKTRSIDTHILILQNKSSTPKKLKVAATSALALVSISLWQKSSRFPKVVSDLGLRSCEWCYELHLLFS